MEVEIKCNIKVSIKFASSLLAYLGSWIANSIEWKQFHLYVCENSPEMIEKAIVGGREESALGWIDFFRCILL